MSTYNICHIFKIINEAHEFSQELALNLPSKRIVLTGDVHKNVPWIPQAVSKEELYSLDNDSSPRILSFPE